jgi:hypothetical protein
MNHFPQAPENNSRVISNFFRKFAEIFASKGAPPVSTTPGANLPPVSMTPAANFASSSACDVDTGGNLPPVSLIPVASNGNNIRLQIIIGHIVLNTILAAVA